MSIISVRLDQKLKLSSVNKYCTPPKLVDQDLSKNEITEIDKRIAKNREAVYLFLTQLPSNSKVKAKRLFVYAIFISQLGQPFAPYAYAVMVSLPPGIERLSPIEQDRILGNKNSYHQIATIPESKVDKIRLTNEQIKQLGIVG